MTVRKKVMLGLIGFSLVPILLTTMVSIRAGTENINALHDDRLKVVAHVSASALQEIVDLHKDEIAVLSVCDSVRNYADSMEKSGGTVPGTSAQAVAVNDYLQNYVGSEGKFDDILILDKNGKSVVSYQPETRGLELGDTDYFKNSFTENNSGGVYISLVHHSLINPEDPESNCIGISSALFSSGGELQGVIVGFMNTRALGRFAQTIKFGKTGLAFVVDRENYILYHPEPRFLNTKTEAPRLQYIVTRCRRGDIDQSGKIVDVMGGVKRIYYYVVLEDELVLVLRQDYSETAKDIRSNIILMISLFAATGGLAAYFGLRMSKSFVAPILKIKSAFDDSRAEGKYVLCEVDSNDELGEMAAGYNEMIRTLETQYQLLQREKQTVERIAMRDSITGLSNRAAFEAGLGEFISGKEDSFGVLFLDMDGFKQVNDVLGHAFGDTLLYMLGRRIKDSAAKFDLCARLGGDEFGLVKIGDKAAVGEAANILLEELRAPFRIELHTLHVTTSIGASMYPVDGDTVESLLKNADIAMYYSKDNGKNMFSFFDGEMQSRVNRQSAIMRVLRKSLEKGEAYLVYQPEIDIKTRKIVAYEALMRINNQELGEIGPSEFIPVAEGNSSLINNLGHWTLVQACRFARRMVDEQGFDGVVAVNISGLQLRRDNFVDEVIGVLEQENLDGRHLQLEITEKIIMSDMTSNAEKLAKLRERGVSVAMDDFGAYYSSFNYLLRMPLDALKIDSVFFAEYGTSDRTRYIGETINNVAHKLGLRVIAEGVETKRHHDLITDIGYDGLQGFYYSHPLTEDDVHEWHKKNK